MKMSELLSDESKWCKGAYARDQEGRDCDEEAECASSWCLIGALRKCYEQERVWPGGPYYTAMTKLLNAAGINTWRRLAEWNDAPERTYEEVMEVVRRAGI